MSARARKSSSSAGDVNPAAVAKFEEFHRKPPRKIGTFPSSFAIPSRVQKQGRALSVLYRSDKIDPETGQQPKKPIDYIHEHDGGVTMYQTIAVPHVKTTDTEVPKEIREATALVLLGQCLGFAYRDPKGRDREAHASSPWPELYATPDGKALLVIEGKKTVVAMVWGGGLGVTARGIVG